MEYQALYRQFRPQNFDEIVEQKAAVATLRKTVQTGKIGHAYLFCGQRGTGKTSIARVFSRAINCENPENGNPCNKCAVCKGILDGSLMDVIEIDAASNRSIDNIRSICEEVNYAPSRTKYKVYIIDEVHMITTEGFNALLKTLEEPPAHAVFLFATTEPHQIPPTILSRCQRFDFRRISVGSIKSRLRYICDHEKINASEDALELIASLSDGAMRDAISYLDQASAMASGSVITPESIEEMTGTVNIDFVADFATVMIEGRFDVLPLKCKELSDSGRDFLQFTLDLADFFRNLLIVRVVPDPVRLIPASAKTLKRMYEIANLTNSQTLVGFINSLSKAVSELKWSPSVRTSFEITMLRLCGRKVRMEEAPLVIPDFSKLQAEAARKISENVASEPSSEDPSKGNDSKDQAAPVPAVPSEEEKKDEDEAVAPEPSESKIPDLTGALEKLKALKKDTAKTDEDLPPIARPKEETVTEEPAKEEEDIKEEPSSAEPEEPLPPLNEPSDVPFPSGGEQVPSEDEIDEEDKPLENQIGLVFNDDDTGEAPKAGIFADLSDSVMDDIDIDELMKEETSEEPKVQASEELSFGDEKELQAPTGRIGETRKTRLTSAVEKSPIVKSKNPAPDSSPRQKWLEIKSQILETDVNLGRFIENARLKILAEGAYIIADGGSSAGAAGNPGFKQVSALVKSKFKGVSKVYVCSDVQFKNVERLYMNQHPGEPVPVISVEDEPENDPAADFMRSLEEAGYNAEIHFGDE